MAARGAPAGARQRNVVQIFGAGGMGKTLYLKAMVSGRIGRAGRVLVVDPNHVFGPRYGRPVSVDRARQVLEAAGPARAFALVVRPAWDEEISDVFAAAYEARNILLAVDEAAEFGGRLRLDTNFLRIVQKGRNHSIDVATTCQNATDLDPRVRLQRSVGVCFRQSLPDSAVRFATEYAGRPELVSALMALPRLHYIRATAEGSISRGQVSIPSGKG